MADQQALDVAAYLMIDAEGDAYAVPVEELERFKLSDEEKAEALSAGGSNGDSDSEVQGHAMNYRQQVGVPSRYYRDRKGTWRPNPYFDSWAEPTVDV